MSDEYRKCSVCLDYVFYCTCWIPPEVEFNESETFELTRGGETLRWNSSTRRLEGPRRLIESILSELDGSKQTICDVGVLWMEEREPVAVAYIAEGLGFALGSSAPKFGYRH